MMCRLFFATLFFFFSFAAATQQLVLPGDHPDPSVVKIGNTFWASATTSNWMPAFPLLQSKDLVHWKTVGHVFNALPSWADYYFWAPELNYDNGKVYVYYSAHKKGGNLCVGVASADKPEGPYKDHGPLVCQSDGSIDAFPIRDESGKLCLVWKEDGNSIGKPTPIWMQELNEERTAVVGEKKELFRNNAPWERNLVEGVSILKHDDYYYAFYAAAGCCGLGCTYNTGVARSKTLNGPWEKYPNNPLFQNEANWKCSGHGTPVEKDGRFYFLYHAYSTNGSVYTGRQGLLQEFRFTPDAWIEFVKSDAQENPVAKEKEDRFEGKRLGKQWEWSVFQNPQEKISKDKLILSALPNVCGAFIGQKTTTPNYTAEVKIDRPASSAASGLGLLGDEKNMLAALLNRRTLQLLQVKNGKETLLSSTPFSKGKKMYLQMRVRNGKEISFFFGTTKRNATALNKQSIDGAYLPPWDRAPRIVLVAKGQANTKGVFDALEIREDRFD